MCCDVKGGDAGWGGVGGSLHLLANLYFFGNEDPETCTERISTQPHPHHSLPVFRLSSSTTTTVTDTTQREGPAQSHTMVNLLHLPVAILVDDLLPLLPNRDLATLRSVCRTAKRLAEDEVLWARKTLVDFSFPRYATARMGGWFNLYRGLSRPQVYVWGEVSHGRSGLHLRALPRAVVEDVHRVRGGIPYPIQQTGAIEAAGAIVEVVAGGWSFHARTADADVWRWGTMDGETFAGPHAPQSDPGFQCHTPQRLHIPKVKAISGGRCHAVALTEFGELLEWRAWGSVYSIQNLPEQVARRFTQLEAGWSFSALLCDGEVYLWYSDWSRDAFTQRYYAGHEREALMYAPPPGLPEDQNIFPINVELLALPPLPLPQEAAKVKQIAAGEDFILALTEQGELYRIDLHLPLHFDEPINATITSSAAQHRVRLHRHLQLRSSSAWQHLPLFCHPDPQPGGGGGITSISAHFRHFVAYLADAAATQETMVLLGQAREDSPVVVPELQARGVIKVSMGDYHFGALTEAGQVLTWGSFAKGALGNWKSPWSEVEPAAAGGRGWWSNLIRGQPRETERERVRERVRGNMLNVAQPEVIEISPQGGGGGNGVYAYDLAFAGWQSLALGLQLPPSHPETEEDR